MKGIYIFFFWLVVLLFVGAHSAKAQEPTTDTLFFAPNAFAPEGCHSGHCFYWVEASAYDQFEMHIYNKWGVLLNTTYNNKPGWDFRINGKVLPEDTYLCVVKLRRDKKWFTYTQPVYVIL